MDIDIRIEPSKIQSNFENLALQSVNHLGILSTLIYLFLGALDWFFVEENFFIFILFRLIVIFIGVIFWILGQVYQWRTEVSFYILLLLPILHLSWAFTQVNLPFTIVYFAEYSLILLASSFLILWKPIHTQIIIFVVILSLASSYLIFQTSEVDINGYFLNGGFLLVFVLLFIFPINKMRYEQALRKIKIELTAEKSKSQLYIQHVEITKQKGLVENQNKTLQIQKEQLEVTFQQITDSLHYAQRIQKAILSDEQKGLEYFNSSFVFFKPRDIVSGDFYWFSNQKNKQIVIMADCTGHGVPGAFMTMLGTTALNEIINEGSIYEPDKILSALDQKILDNLQSGKNKVEDGMDIGVLVFDRSDRKIAFAGAKTPLYYKNNTQEVIQTIKGAKYPVGSSQFGNQKNFETQEIKWQEDTWFFLASDGFQDQFGGEEGKKFMKPEFRELLNRISLETTPEKAKQILENTLSQWQGKLPQTDDILVIGMKI